VTGVVCKEKSEKSSKKHEDRSKRESFLIKKLQKFKISID